MNIMHMNDYAVSGGGCIIFSYAPTIDKKIYGPNIKFGFRVLKFGI